MDREALLALAERVEKATGPDRVLDGEIFCALGLAPFVEGAFDAYRAPAYTASLDAAMTLVPEGWLHSVTAYPGRPVEAALVECHFRDGQYWHGKGMIDTGRIKAATPALALTAACLRALAATSEGSAS